MWPFKKKVVPQPVEINFTPEQLADYAKKPLLRRVARVERLRRSLEMDLPKEKRAKLEAELAQAVAVLEESAKAFQNIQGA